MRRTTVSTALPNPPPLALPKWGVPWTALALFSGALLLAACQRQTATPDAASATPAATAPAAPGTAPPSAEPGGKDRPRLRIATVDGKSFDLAAHRGKWVVVNFWATWCAPCLKEMPELSALDALRDHIEVVGLAYEDIEPADMQAFLKQHPVVYPVALVDTYNPPADFDTPRGLPMTYLIGPEGQVAKKILGPVTAAEIEAAIAKAGGPKPTA